MITPTETRSVQGFRIPATCRLVLGSRRQEVKNAMAQIEITDGSLVVTVTV